MRTISLLCLALATALVPPPASGAEVLDPLALARGSTLMQAEMAGLALPEPAPLAPGAPSVEALAILAAHGVAPSLRDLIDISALDRAPVRDEVAAFLAAFRAFDAAAASRDPAAQMAARMVLLEKGIELSDALRLVDATPGDVVAPPALVLRFSPGDDHYASDVALVYDAGGNDVYANNAGGSGIGRDLDSCFVGAVPAAAALFDLGGADRYGVPDRGCGAVGGGQEGAGLLYDEGGAADVYLGANDGVTGGAVLGTGFLLDDGGDDQYLAGGWGTNGGGYPGGFGMLLDGGGNDVYVGTHDAVNGGGLAGSGFLRDLSGDDAYVATGSGTNGGAAFGRGLLLDEGGRDWYDDGDGLVGYDITMLVKGAAGAQIDEA